MSSRTLLAVPCTSAVRPLAEQMRAAQAAGADLVELRVDCIGDVAAVERLLGQPRILPLIVTVRSPDEGGCWTGDEAERLALLDRLAQLKPEYVDVEYATWQRSAPFRQKIGQTIGLAPDDAVGGPGRAAQTQLVLSHHDLAGTPADIDAVFDSLAATPADIIKAVFTAHDATDACRVLVQLRKRAAGRPVIALAMGEAGLATRVLARKFGAFLTFATLHSHEASAPGQPLISDLRQLYAWDRIGPGTRVYGVVGWPVSHSQSPLIHNAAMTATDIDGVFLPFPVQPSQDGFSAFMDCVTQEPGLDIVGLSVTVPHKEHALRWLEQHGQQISPAARQCGAVNTLARQGDGAWLGDNTDGSGALAALETAGQTAESRPVAVLGAGGAARAVVAALRERGCPVTIYNRTSARAEQLARDLRCAWKPWSARRDYAGTTLINCTTVGLWPAVDESPMPADALRPDTVVFDTVYRPQQTRLLRESAARGCTTVSGVEMFIGQAAAQYARWHGRPAPVAAMRTTLGSESA